MSDRLTAIRVRWGSPSNFQADQIEYQDFGWLLDKVAELEAIIGGLCSYPLCDCKSKKCLVIDAPIPEVCARSDLIEAEAREKALRVALGLPIDTALATKEASDV